ncbi:hypothetical protein G3N95_07760 [Paraburkholderia sp. Tr-20389]|uniref:hypothetical protein n=1 Tax=Paraburkholderia sp. Tr-20389 TaxID=2703903 RepID=UPI00197F3BC3|nr:hypothetical protein [Paraburkholderia sp. Tr-20389]MBN3752835.1 hypothetical protein [Paraburkholderia sp. Tr-20389]
MNSDAIGGYLELELPPGNGEHYPDALRFQSARAAFLALLMAGRPERIWMPWYNCETMLEPPAMAGIPVQRYRIDASFDIAEDIVLGENDWLLYVNYFGVCDAQVDRVLSRFPRTQIVIDNSQAFFSPPTACLATLYSPRKFFGIPDGGYLITGLPVEEPEEQDTGSIERLQPLLIRIDRGPEAGYAGIRAARATLRGQQPKRMSTLTQRLLAHLDYASAFERRGQNFARYHQQLGGENALASLDARVQAPLCYPFWNHRADLHAALAAKRIFVAKYWPDTRGGTGMADDLEFRLSTECLALPCDQRYGEVEVDRVIAALREAGAAGQAR